MKKANYGKRILSFVTVIAMILSFTAMIPAASAADLERAYLFDVDFEDGTMANKASSGYTFAHYYNDLHTVTSYETVSERNSKALKIDIAGNQTGVAKFGQDIIDPALNLVDNTTWYEMSFKFDKSIPNVRLYAKNHAAHDVGIFRIATDGKVYINGSSHNIEVNGLTLETGNWYDLKIAVDNHNRDSVCPRVYVWVNGEQYTAGEYEADGAHIWREWAGDVDMISEMNRMMLYVNSDQTEGTMWMDSFKVYNTPCSMKAGLNIGKYYDIDFENSSWENAVGTSTIAPNTDGHFKPAVVIEDDAIKGSKVAKITGSGTAGQYGCIRDNSVSHSSIKENKVSWYEMSFKFDSKISAIRMEAGEYPFMIQESGKLRIGGLESGEYEGAEIADVTLKVGEWYNLKVAVDCIDKWADTDTKYYAWLNGELLTTGETPITGCTVSKGYSAKSGVFRYWMFIPSDGSDIGVSFDDIKAYTTDSAVKVNGAFTVDASAIFDGTQISVNGFNFENDKITVSEDTTVAQLSAAITLDESANAVFVKDGAVVSDTSVLAKETVLYVNSSKNVGVKKYSIVIPEFRIDYFDVDFEDGSYANTVEDGRSFGVTYNDIGTLHFVQTDAVSGSKAYMIPTLAEAGGAVRFGNINTKLTAAELGNNTVWTELSFKFEDAVSNIQYEGTNYLFSVINGELYLGGIGGNIATPSRKVENFEIKTGEWYHLVIALDNKKLREEKIKKEDGSVETKLCPAFFAWINGEMLDIEGADKDGASIWGYYNTAASTGSPTNIDTLALTVYNRGIGTTWIDNFKIYTTRGGFENAQYDSDSVAPGAKIVSDKLKIENAPNGTIYAPEMTVAQLSEKLPVNENGYVWTDGKNIVTDTNVTAIGKTVHSLSGGVAVKSYTVVKGALVDLLPETAIYDADAKTASIRLTNNAGEAVNKNVIFAVYAGDKLIDSAIVKKTVAEGGDTVTSRVFNIEDGANVTVKAFLWDMTTLYPETTAVEF